MLGIDSYRYRLDLGRSSWINDLVYGARRHITSKIYEAAMTTIYYTTDPPNHAWSEKTVASSEYVEQLMIETSQAPELPDIIDVKKIKIVPDAASFTGYSIVAINKEAEDQPGTPASPFEVVMWREIERLRKKINSLTNR